MIFCYVHETLSSVCFLLTLVSCIAWLCFQKQMTVSLNGFAFVVVSLVWQLSESLWFNRSRLFPGGLSAHLFDRISSEYLLFGRHFHFKLLRTMLLTWVRHDPHSAIGNRGRVPWENHRNWPPEKRWKCGCIFWDTCILADAPTYHKK
jgi:hypothetical protein